MKIAVIDMGTNTFHLLIASVNDGELKVLHKEKTAVRLGKGGISKGFITEEAEKRAIKALKRFKETIEIENTTQIFATATSAIRNAKNGSDLTKKIKEKTGIEVRVISGDEEAEYIYNGVKQALKIGSDPSLIMDIGGGSIEFIIANSKKIFWKRSFEIGGQRLIDRFHQNDPISLQEKESLESYLLKELQPLIEESKKYDISTLIGSSGTFDTLSDIYRMEENLEKDPDETEFPLPIDHYYSIVKDIISKKESDRLNIPGMIPLRVEMIVVAVILVDFVLNTLDLSNIRVSAYALKEGVLLNTLSKVYNKVI
ncbi:MAG: exopolyphosphatase [bacterium]|nr:exopolyphosphatase [bacterium]